MMDEKRVQLAKEIGVYIADHKGGNPVVIDISEHSSWAECFIIATVTSVGHLKGLTRELWGFLADKEVVVYNRHKDVGTDGWVLIDCGDIVIHLMSSEMREFYALEKLWHTGKLISGEHETAAKPLLFT
ncbi:MAG: ribosome silencing factor [Sphaerochaetaceae bacterium]